MANQRQAVAVPEQYIALMDLDFGFSESELEIFLAMWDSGQSIYEIAKKMKRDPDEIVLLIMDQARQKKIKERPGGVYGV